MTALRFTVETDRSLVSGKSHSRYLLVSIVAPEGKPRERPPTNLGLVLDRSGSMAGEKIRLSKDAAVAAVRRLAPDDRFAVVAYDDQVDVVVPSTPASPQAVDAAVRSILRIEARGSTDLCGGWLRCCEQVALAQTPEAVTRVLLLTDGLANRGIVDQSEIVRHAAELRTRGIATTTLGVGEDFDEHLLGRIADDGGGHFYYVERDEQIPAAIETEVGEALEVTLRRARLRVGPAAVAAATPIPPYPTRREGRDWVLELGDLVSLQELPVPLRVAFAPEALAGPGGSGVRLSLVLASDQAADAQASLEWTLAPPAAMSGQPRNRVVDRAVAEAYAALARREAGRLNREGNLAAARDRIEETVARIKEYAGDDGVLNGLVRDLERDKEAYSHRMESHDLKARYMGTYGSLKARWMLGGSRRAGNREPPDSGGSGNPSGNLP
jgi:Ca-activated chloride channel family protein